MSWAIGYDSNLKIDVGYGVPCECNHPDCNEQIDRGLSYVCGGDMYGGERGCGQYYCSKHLGFNYEDDDSVQLCERCLADDKPFTSKPDTQEWILWKLCHKSWREWRNENPEEVNRIRALI